MRPIDADTLINLIPAPIYTSPDGQDLVLMSDVMETIKRAATIEPEPHYDEWCTDCKEYDHERHCCPRWNRVNRETLKDAQSERKTGYWIDDGIVGYGALMIEYHGVKCDQCGWSTSLLIPRNFCPKCGAYMKGESNEQT